MKILSFNSLIVTSSIAASILLSACGSGDSTDGTINPIVPTSITGQLVDSYVQNADYVCGDGTLGLTDMDGRFTCPSLPVTFQLGALKLGKISTMPTDAQIFPQDLLGVDRADVNNSSVVAMARFLQSCDDDGVKENGLKIRQEIKDSLTADVEFDENDIDSYTTITVDDDAAVEHLTQTTEFVAALNAATLVPAAVKEAMLTTNSTLDQTLKNTLSFMGNEERLAYDVYNKLYETSPSVTQLTNIATKSEIAHIQAVQLLVKKYITSYDEFTNTDLNELGYKDTQVADMQAGTYDISELQNLYYALVAKGATSDRDALEVGCMVEVTDINDLDRDVALAQAANATDVATTFEFLRTASYAHYWAFDSGLVAMGETTGCCSLGIIDGVNYCHPEYPQNENGSDNAGLGDGTGVRRGRQ